MANPTKLNPFKGIYGLPPSSHVSDDMIINSMPIMQITPGTPSLATGLNLFTVDDAWTKYNTLLANNGFTTPQPIKLAFIADNFPTDTFTNDYGETFLQKFTDVASAGLSELVQMSGQKTATGALKQYGKFGEELGTDLGGTLGKVVQIGGGKLAGGATSLEQMVQNQTGKGGLAGGAATMLNKMIAGNRVDFPMIWRNSGFTPSYTATIRLYNPNPSSEESTNQYIVGPLAVILCLGLPQSEDGKTYLWPFFHKIKAKGIYNLDPAIITNITIIKGGDQQQIAYTQRLSMVDVRIDFGSLYTSMLAESDGHQGTNRPTLQNYLNSLKQDDKSLYIKRSKMVDNGRLLAGVHEEGQPVRVASVLSQIEKQRLIARNDSIRRRQSQTVTETVQSTRVPTTTKAKEDTLSTETASGFLA